MLDKLKSLLGQDEVEGNGLITGEGFGLLFVLACLAMC